MPHKINCQFPVRNLRDAVLAEIELSVLGKQCLNRRIPDRKTFKKEVAAWQEKRNASLIPMNWRFTTEDARIKLKKLYPTINSFMTAY